MVLFKKKLEFWNLGKLFENNSLKNKFGILKLFKKQENYVKMIFLKKLNLKFWKSKKLKNSI